ncbi:MAG TPA: CinA family nicotinamide mononucleotide deamidase-related protein [Dehalococcoidia bacterium]|nr:CinA family nicotinamide mononucleotide deamidase-related protein [Dehalococcoidia bacterium]
MTSRYLAELISVGTELLRGEVTDTNAVYLASELPLLGIELQAMSTAADDREQLCQLLRQAMERSDLVIAGGGLGPTEDDLTRDCIASVLNEEMTVDPDLEQQLRAMFSRTGREMPAHNIKQAFIIPSAISLPNPRGTAPGWWVEKDNKTIVALPGPPRELKPMWKNEVIPRLRLRFPGEEILSRTIKTFVIAEARVSELVQPFFQSDNPTLGIYSHPDGIHIRMVARGDNARQLLDTTEAQLEEILAPHVWGKDNDTLEGIICGWLSRRGLTLATMEDGTGGLLANIIADTRESSNCYRGGLVVCSNETKAAWGVPPEVIEQHGTISAEVAAAMAVAVRERFSADFGLGTTPVASTDNPEGKQPGLAFIGVADANGTQTWQQNYPPTWEGVRNRAAISALFRLRERMIELKLNTS